MRTPLVADEGFKIVDGELKRIQAAMQWECAEPAAGELGFPTMSGCCVETPSAPTPPAEDPALGSSRLRALHLWPMTDSSRQQLLEAIRRALEPDEGVRAAILFGSQATGRAVATSDIDVAVLMASEQLEQGAEQCFRRIVAALSCELAADRLDVIILNTASPALAFQVLKHGSVAFERDRRDLHRFRVRTYAAHADYEHVERFFRSVTKERALAGLKRG